MSAVNSKIAQSLFPLLTAVLLATACSDSTAPTTEMGNSGGGLPEADLPSDGTSSPPDYTPPAPGGPTAGPGDTPAASAGLKPAFLQGDMGACVVSGNFCYRQLDAGLTSPLHLAVQYWGGSNTFAYIWIYNYGSGWEQSYAVRYDDLAVWYKSYGGWYRYQLGTVSTGPTSFVMNPRGDCGLQYLCLMGMLDADRRLPNGDTVPRMLWNLVWRRS